MQLGNILTYGVLPWATVIIQKYMTAECFIKTIQHRLFNLE